MSDVYTEEELKGMSRVQLRRAAIAVLDIDNKEASNSKSGDLIERILEAQSGGGKKESKTTKKTTTRKASKVTRTSRKEESDDQETPESSSADLGDLSVVVDRLDALGKALDESQETNKELIEGVLEGIADVQRQQYILFGLVSDIYKAHYEPDEFEQRCEELDGEWENRGNE